MLWNYTSRVEATFVGLSAFQLCICSDQTGCCSGRCFSRSKLVIVSVLSASCKFGLGRDLTFQWPAGRVPSALPLPWTTLPEHADADVCVGAALLLSESCCLVCAQPLRASDFVGEVCRVLQPSEQCQGRRTCHYDGGVVLDLREQRSVAAYVEHACSAMANCEFQH